MGLLDRIFGTSDGLDSAERILAGSGSAPETVAKAGPPAPGPVSLLTHPFLRGESDTGNGRGLAKPFEKSAWVQRAIKHVSEPICSVPLRFATQTQDGLKTFVNPTLAGWWNWPAIGPQGPLSLAQVVESSVGWLKLRGEFFWLLSDNWLIPGAVRDPFVIGRPDSLREVVSADGGKLLGWQFRDAKGTDHVLLPEQVVHVALWNPYHAIRGCPEYASAQVAAEADYFAAEFQRNLSKSNGDRGPIITSKTQLSQEQVAQIEASLRAKKRAAQTGELKTTFLAGDVQVQDPQIAQADAEFIAARIENRKEIYMAFGVPSSFAEQKARATTAHESDRFVLLEDTCIPTSTRVAAPVAMLSMRLLNIDPRGPQALRAYFDFQQHSTMLAARTERIEAAQKLWQMGMPFKDVNTFLNLQAPAFAGDDQSFLPLQIQTLAEAQTVQPAPAPAKKPKGGKDDPDDDPTENDDDPTQLMIRALLAPAPSLLERALALPVAEPQPVPLDGPAVPPVPEVRTTPEPGTDEAARNQAWSRQMKMRRPAEKLMQKAVGRVIFAARGEVLRKIEATGKKAAVVPVQKDDDDKKADDPTAPVPHPGKPADVLFDPQTFAQQMQQAVEKISRHTIQTAGDEWRDEVGVEDPWVVPASTVLNALRDREPLIRNASDEIFESIKSTLEEGFQNGDTTAELADRVRAAFNGISDDRAQAIAVTETGAAYSTGREASAKDAGYKTAEWLSSRDSKVRPTHKAADGQVVQAGQEFTVGNDRMTSPCNGSLAEENCNCRCVVLYRPGKP